MKTEAHDIVKSELLQLVNSTYGLSITALTFLPLGEDAYAYAAHAPDGSRYFVRAQHISRAPGLEVPYSIAYALHTQYGLTQVVAPYATTQGTFTIRFGDYSVAVFPFIDGATLYDQTPSDVNFIQAATLLAAVHSSNLPSTLAAIPREDYENPFEPAIRRALRAIDELTPANLIQQQVLELLTNQHDDIMTTIGYMEQLQQRAQTLNNASVLTHGDPNLANLIKDPQGILHLTDWGEVALGPPERDLAAFTGRGRQSKLFLHRYASLRLGLHLHQEVYAFYFYRWSMQEIADYTTRILFENMGLVEDEHAWAELQDYLPVRHAEIAQSLGELQIILDQL